MKGWECVYTPETSVCHCHSATVKKYFSKEYIEHIFLRNRLLLNYPYLNRIDHFIFTLKHHYRYIRGKIRPAKADAVFMLVFKMYLEIKERKRQRKKTISSREKITLNSVWSKYFNQ